MVIDDLSWDNLWIHFCILTNFFLCGSTTRECRIEDADESTPNDYISVLIFIPGSVSVEENKMQLFVIN